MIYHFKDIENGQIKKSYTTLQIENHTVEIPPLQKIIDGQEVLVEDVEAMLLAEKHGGELLTKQGKPPKDPEKYKAGLIAHNEETT